MKEKNDNLYFLEGGGEMGEMMRTMDWNATVLGPPQGWPQELRTTLDNLLGSLFPMFLFWGEELLCFYNDAYRPSLGDNGKHPHILGKAAREAWPEVWEEVVAPMTGQIISGGKSLWSENRLIPILRNGRMEDVYWTFSYSPVRDSSGKISGVLIVSSETTNAVQDKRRLTESELRFRELADHSPMWIWITDAEVNVEYANKELLEYVGIGHYKEFTGQIWVDMVHPADIDTVYSGFGEAVENKTGFALEYRVKNTNTGEYEWFMVRGAPRMENGELTGFIGTGMNVHKQRTFSEELRKEVGMRTKELSTSNARLERSNKELQSFAYISSHDLQEPLRKIQTFCSILMDSEYERLSEQGKLKFDRMQSAARRMQVLINDLLAYSRLDTESRKLETICLSSVVSEIRVELTEDISAKNAFISVKSSCNIDVVPFQFTQLLNNLVSNSLKYSKDNGQPIVEIEGKIISAADVGDSRAIKDTEYSWITVNDNGIGFDAAYSEKIFEVFQRLHGRNEYRGTGVGLAIVKKIAENHKGFVRATGRPGEGSIFEIFIPRNSPD